MNRLRLVIAIEGAVIVLLVGGWALTRFDPPTVDPLPAAAEAPPVVPPFVPDECARSTGVMLMCGQDVTAQMEIFNCKTGAVTGERYPSCPAIAAVAPNCPEYKVLDDTTAWAYARRRR